jgi:hypothetical protein
LCRPASLRDDPGMRMLAVAVVLVAALLPAQEPLRLGVLAADAADGPDAVFVRGAKMAAAERSAGGAPLELVFAPATTPAAVAAALARFAADGVAGVVAAPDAMLAEAATRAAAGKLPCAAFRAGHAAVLPVLDRLLEKTFCMTRVVLLRDKNKEAIEFGKQLAKGALAAPTTLLWEHDLALGGRAFAKALEKGRPEVWLFDAEPAAVAQFVQQHLADDRAVIVLMPRAFGADTRALGRRVFALHGLSPGCVPTTSRFRSDYEVRYGVPGCSAAEGYEGVHALAQAFERAGTRDAAAVEATLRGLVLDGVRGRYAFEPALGAFAPPLGVWIVDGDRPQPYVPLVVPLQAVGTSPGTGAGEARRPQERIGEPFGTWRTRQFQAEDGAQLVLCQWAEDGGHATIGDDLQLLGLSTAGKDPLLDHLVREEILARVLAIASTKFGRTATGAGVAGQSLRIAFVSHLPAGDREKKRLRTWQALFGGDHSGAGGEAFGTFCRVYSSFLRRTIFQPHALQPALTPADRWFLDGTYAFGSDYDLDRRSELIRALINGYAGSMALTLAHEVGHLAGLGHVTDDPVEIMNVDEGAGIDYRDARFGASSWASMRERYGLVGDKPGKPGRK